MTAIAAAKTPNTTSNVKRTSTSTSVNSHWDRAISHRLFSGYRGADTPPGNAGRVSPDTSTPLLARPVTQTSAPESPFPDNCLLGKLRGSGMRRPHVDPELAGGLREWLEDSLAGPASTLPRTSRVIRVNGRLLATSEPAGSLLGRPADPVQETRDNILRNLVRCLFRQWVTTRSFGRPIEDALAALSVHAYPGATVEAVNRLSPEKRRALADEVAEHAERIASTWPVLSPTWYPRTSERISIPLCGGRILLGGVVDLVIGAQAGEEATVCIVQVDTSLRDRRSHEAELPFYALLETLRSGASPSRVASYSTRTGDLHVEPVDEHVLAGALLKTVEAAERMCAIQAEASAMGPGDPR
jgi:hypothetical protein